MENICQNCEYWDKSDDSAGYCELQPIIQDYNQAIDVPGDEPYKMTDANGTCEDFEPRYEEAE